ncbi:MAG: DMT family transporter [Bdellovibrionota bacterium]
MNTPTRLKADLLLVAVAAIWGTAFVAQSIAAKAGLAFHFNGACFTLASLLLLPFARVSKIPREQWGWMLAAGGLLFAGSALQQLGIFYTKVANASFLTSLYVIFTPFLLWVGFRERPRGLDFLSVVLALAGAFLLSTAGRIEFQFGDILEVTGALFWGFHLVLVGKFTSRYNSISFAAGQFLICGLLNFAAGALTENAGPLFSLPVAGAVAYRAVLSIGFGYTMQIWAQKFTRATDAALIFSLESVFAALTAALFLSERLLFPQLVGCAMILLAASLSQVKTAPRAV